MKVEILNLEDLVFVVKQAPIYASDAMPAKGSRAWRSPTSNNDLIGAMALRGLVGEMTLPGLRMD